MQESFALIYTYNIDICIVYIYIYYACMFCVCTYIYIYKCLWENIILQENKSFFFKVPRDGSKEDKLVFKTLICSPYFPQFPQPRACSWLPRDSYGQFGKHPVPWNALLFFHSCQTDRQTHRQTHATWNAFLKHFSKWHKFSHFLKVAEIFIKDQPPGLYL